MPAKPGRTEPELIRTRIRDGIMRKRGALLHVDSVVSTGPPASTSPNRAAESAELERDVQELHDRHVLQIRADDTNRRVLRSFVVLVRRAAAAVLRPMLGDQSAFNGATARAVSTLRNQAIRNERLLHESARALGEQTSALLDLERTARALERQFVPLEQRRLNLDQFSLANTFRGSEDSVKARQRMYVPRFVGREVIDLGCGRGEFLELLREANIDARGIELDGRMIEHCRAKRLVVDQRDALEFLAGLPDETVGGLFAAQVIEHLPAVDLVRLVREARRVLEPGGVLLVESVNPESLLTFAEFYIDPTHVRPYHRKAVRWLFEQEGFVDVEEELSVDPEPARLLPPLSEAGVDAPDFDAAVSSLNTLVYGSLAYAVSGATPSAQP